MEMDQNIFKHLLNTEVTLYQLCKLDLSYLHYLLLPMEYLLSLKVVIIQLYKLNMCPLYIYLYLFMKHLLMNKLTTILDELLLPS